MGVTNFEDLKQHIGHKIVCVSYGYDGYDGFIKNVSLECETCNEVLLDFDRDKEETERNEKTDETTNEIMDMIRQEFNLNPDSDRDDLIYGFIHNKIKELIGG